jgi:hypothetical protein
VDFSRYPEYVPEDGGQRAGSPIPFFDHVEDYFWEINVSEDTLSEGNTLVSFNNFKFYLLMLFEDMIIIIDIFEYILV